MKEYLTQYDNRNLFYFNWLRNKDTYIYDSWLRLIVRSFAEPVVDRFSDDELYQLYENKDHEDFLNYFSRLVDKEENEILLNPSAHKSWWSKK